MADTYTLYFVRGDAHLFDGVTNQSLRAKIHSSEAVMEIFIQTDSSSSKGTLQTYKLDFVQEWDEAGIPKSNGSRDVGTKFKVQEKGDEITYEFSDTRLERWISISPPKPLLQPVFTSQESSSQIRLKKGEIIVLSGVSVDENHNKTSRKIRRYFIIERS